MPEDEGKLLPFGQRCYQRMKAVPLESQESVLTLALATVGLQDEGSKMKTQR